MYTCFISIFVYREEKSTKKAVPCGALLHTRWIMVFCYLCTTEKARVWCVECQFNLCAACEGHQKKIPSTKDHRLLTRKRGNRRRQKDTQKCLDHPQEEIQFFCPTHDAFSCVECHTLEHGGCAMQNIPNISKKFKSSKDYKKLKA